MVQLHHQISKQNCVAFYTQPLTDPVKLRSQNTASEKYEQRHPSHSQSIIHQKNQKGRKYILKKKRVQLQPTQPVTLLGGAIIHRSQRLREDAIRTHCQCLLNLCQPVLLDEVLWPDVEKKRWTYVTYVCNILYDLHIYIYICIYYVYSIHHEYCR